MFKKLMTLLAQGLFGDAATQKSVSRAERLHRLSEEVTQYYWDVKYGFVKAMDPLAVSCPSCGAGRFDHCIVSRHGAVMPKEWCHPERWDWVGDVHEEFAQMDGRDSA